MSLEISKGLTEDGIVAGNNFDKYASKNPIVRWMMTGFEEAIADLTAVDTIGSIHEVGCGEGFWSLRWQKDGRQVKGTDFSGEVIKIARSNAQRAGQAPDIFQQRSIYDLTAEHDAADLVVCCEVLEHLEDPRKALDILHSITKGHLVVSVPREPIWRALNMARLSYIRDLGNTPGHIQHWSATGIKNFVSERFHILEVRKPLPWTALLCKPR
ncbi:3-demethylubiquinone-9 3-methyltransferase domain protein [Hyphomonas neptunium ATCC 15444]|uniref:3-demethylubiquinone-9 3-methyltransferase domain protein n=2 Tax=Hyphomonas TaxID=85 RepID=Q0C415_HYPNA|nr:MULTISPECIES: class I SAM-dependent methyltransferase [Hyphomonas]ABI77281.1 3-demethylubiquinone-9 3-methyltransferase domain protein [Hyphomonas neptunium ATCC 15444]